MLRSYRGKSPRLGQRVYVDASAQVIGDVELGDHASVWMNVVLRGDVGPIRVGPHTSIQDNSVVHGQRDAHPVFLADHVTVGHSVTLHGCRVGSWCLIGIGAIVLNGAEVGEESIVAAGALVTEGTVVPPRSLVRGLPGRVIRTLTEDELLSLRGSSARYHEYKESYLAEAERPEGAGARRDGAKAVPEVVAQESPEATRRGRIDG